MSDSKPARGGGQLVVDLQGPFQLDVKLIQGGAPPFAIVSFWPDVSVFVSKEETADEIIAAMEKAKDLLRRANQERNKES